MATVAVARETGSSFELQIKRGVKMLTNKDENDKNGRMKD
jgi:hypothetical protein